MDEFVVSPVVHQAVGGLVLLSAAFALFVSGRAARRQEANPRLPLALIAFQLALLLQALVGVKLLDQGMGVMQKYVHYLGGFGALGLLMLHGWRPRPTAQATARQALWLTAAATLFSVLSFTIGGLYARGSLG